jgi:DNA-binding transcriptional LysR family regulator
MRAIDFYSMKLFIAVAEELNMPKAAARENIALAALSKRIAGLESDLDVSLFERSARGVALTGPGHALLQHARGVLFAVERLGSELKDYSRGVRGYVRIAANTSAITRYLPEELRKFMQSNPGVHLDIQERLSIEVVKAVKDGIADIGIFSSNIAVDRLQTFPYRKDRLVIVTPRSHPLARKQAVRLEEALEFDFVGLEGASAIHALLSRESSILGKPPRLRCQVRSFGAMCRMVQNGFGIAILPELAVNQYLRPLHLAKIALVEEWGQRELSLCVRDLNALTPSARQLLTHLQDRSVPPPAAKSAGR